MIDTVVFDIGNVLMKFDYMPFIRDLLQDEEAVDRVNRAIFVSRLWDELDRGEDTDEILQKMIDEDPEYEEQIRLVFDSIGECMECCDYAAQWVWSLHRRGFRVLYLSNYSPHTMAANLGALKAVPFMDGGIFSCDVKINKPDPAIFRLLIDRYSLDPAKCAYIDDDQKNVDVARELGFTAIKFTNYKQANAELNWEIGKSRLKDSGRIK